MAGHRTASIYLDYASDGFTALHGYIDYSAFGLPDGKRVLLATNLPTLVPDDKPGTNDLFVVDVATGTLTRITTAPDGTPANADSYPVTYVFGDGSPISPNGTAVLFTSTATNLASAGSGGTQGLYLFNFATGATTRIDATADGTPANRSTFPIDLAFSPDGTSLLFGSESTNLVPDDTNDSWDLFAKNLATGAITRVNTAADGTQSSPYAWIANPLFFPDSTRVLFESTAGTLVPGDAEWTFDIFVKDLVTGAITRINTAADGTPANAGDAIPGITRPRVSADGTLVLFASPASNLVPGDTNGEWDLFLKNLATGAITRVNTAADGSQAHGQTSYLFVFHLSDDGTHALFGTEADNLVPGDTNGGGDLFLKNLTTGAIRRVDDMSDRAELRRLLGNAATALFPEPRPGVAAQPLLKDLLTGAPPGTNFSISVNQDYRQSRPGATSFVVTVSRSGVANPADTITWSITGTGPSPVNAADFANTTLPSGALAFAAGEVAQTFTLHIAHNSIAEPDEAYAITLASAADGTERARYTGTIATNAPQVELIATGSDSGTTIEETSFEAYAGPVAGIERQWLRDDPHGTSVLAASPNWFIHTGSGDDIIFANSGRNVLDGGAGSNFLTGGAGPDSFFVGAALSDDPTWTTIANFDLGDDTTFWGIDPAKFELHWFDNLGAPRATGLTLLAVLPNTPVTALTLTGYTKADLDNGTLRPSFGHDPASNTPYLHISHT